ncbi:MAG: hypothetical protein ABIA04_08960 [Pseudomonadota bacterium]
MYSKHPNPKPINPKSILTLILILIIIPQTSFFAANNNKSKKLFELILEKLKTQDEHITSFSMEVEKEIIITRDHKKYSPTILSYTFDFQKPQNFKAYISGGKTDHLLLGNNEYILEYLPKHKEALKTLLTKLPNDLKFQKYQKAISQINIPYLLLYNELKTLNTDNVEVYEDMEINQEKAYLLKFKSKYKEKDDEFCLWFHKTKFSILKTMIKGILDERPYLTIEYSNFVNINNNIWLPKKISYKSINVDKKGEEEEYNLKFKTFTINKIFDKNYFFFTQQEGINIRTKYAKNK